MNFHNFTVSYCTFIMQIRDLTRFFTAFDMIWEKKIKTTPTTTTPQWLWFPYLFVCQFHTWIEYIAKAFDDSHSFECLLLKFSIISGFCSVLIIYMFTARGVCKCAYVCVCKKKQKTKNNWWTNTPYFEFIKTTFVHSSFEAHMVFLSWPCLHPLNMNMKSYISFVNSLMDVSDMYRLFSKHTKKIQNHF